MVAQEAENHVDGGLLEVWAQGHGRRSEFSPLRFGGRRKHAPPRALWSLGTICPEARTTRIGDLSSQELARYATIVFLHQGRHVLGARLTYHALALDPRNGPALRALSDLLDSKGTEHLAGLVMEYALAPETKVSGSPRAEIDDLRFFSLWTWGFSKHKSGSASLTAEDFKGRTQFVVDEERYRNSLAPWITEAGGLVEAFKGAHTLIGAMGGLLEHKTLGGRATAEESFHPERFVRTKEYDRWLREKTKPLDALEAALKTMGMKR